MRDKVFRDFRADAQPHVDDTGPLRRTPVLPPAPPPARSLPLRLRHLALRRTPVLPPGRPAGRPLLVPWTSLAPRPPPWPRPPRRSRPRRDRSLAYSR